MANKNKISVNLASSSYFLGQASPIEIRDSSLSLIDKLSRGESIEVEAPVHCKRARCRAKGCQARPQSKAG